METSNLPAGNWWTETFTAPMAISLEKLWRVVDLVWTESLVQLGETP